VTLVFDPLSGLGTAGRARKRIEDLLADAREVRACDDGWWIRAPMDDTWQRWEKWSQDPKKWAEQVSRDVPLRDALDKGMPAK